MATSKGEFKLSKTNGKADFFTSFNGLHNILKATTDQQLQKAPSALREAIQKAIEAGAEGVQYDFELKVRLKPC